MQTIFSAFSIHLRKDFPAVLNGIDSFCRRHRTGVIAEFSPTDRLFTTPTDPRTEAYITGRIG